MWRPLTRNGPAEHPDEELTGFALGMLPAGQREVVARHLLGCPRCQQELDAATEALGGLGLAAGEAPGWQRGRARLLAAAASLPQAARGGGRRPGAARVAAFFDIPEARAAEVLGAVVVEDRWLRLSAKGHAVMAVAPGPAHGAALGMLARFPAGYRMPRHQHRGDERALVLSGGYRGSDGGVFHAGDEAWMAGGSSHELYVLPDEDCVLALLFETGIEFAQE